MMHSGYPGFHRGVSSDDLQDVHGASGAALQDVRSTSGAPVTLAADCAHSILALNDAKANEHQPAQQRKAAEPQTADVMQHDS
jgi:hypothetical protein